ncbi:MAG TPA: protein kinase [Polyangiales bacterium]|nr:protein kinase [Polyangiales bacterium]
MGRLINDRYRIVGIIARGGMGKVYRAEQLPLGRLVALKVLHTNYTGDNDPEFHKRFFLEASIASKLTHPNTVTIFDYGKTDDDVYYIAMELLEGRTMHRALRDGPFPAERTMHIARQICRSLREAHGMGVIHRDLKPANVYLLQHGDEGDVVKVLDFGLVKNLEDKSEELTQAGVFMGSPKYMSPEQIRGDACDGRADIYALGVMMFEMLTGKAPYDRPNSVHTLMAHIKEDIPAFREFNAAVRVPAALEAVVRKCMAKQPEDRYPSMDAVLMALKRVSGIQTTMTGELRAVDLPDSRSVEVPLYGFATAKGELLSGGSSHPPHEFSLTSTPANGQTLIDRTLLNGLPAATPLSNSRPLPPLPGMLKPSTATPLAHARPSAVAPPVPPITNSGPPTLPELSAQPASTPVRTLATQARAARTPFVAGMVAAALLGGIALLVLGGGDKPKVVEVAKPEAVAPVPTEPVVQKSVLVSLRTTPPGAMVFVGDKGYGPTPTQVEWTGEEAAIGREVTLRFVRRGYQELTVTRQIRGPLLEIEAQKLDQAEAAPSSATKSSARPARAQQPDSGTNRSPY